MSDHSTATPSDAILAVSRLLGPDAASRGPDAVLSVLVCEAQRLFGVAGALLLAVDESARSLTPLTAEPALSAGRPRGGHPLATVPAARDLLELRLAAAHGTLDGTPLAAVLGWPFACATVLFVPVRDRGRVSHVLALAREQAQPFTPAEQELAQAFAAAAGGALAQVRLADEHARHIAQQSALARAAKTLNESLDIAKLLTAICVEAGAILDADAAIIYLGDEDGMVGEAAAGFDERALGYRLAPGQGLAGRVASTGQSQLSNDYQALAQPPDDSPFREILASIAVPMHWDGELRGVLSVGYRRPCVVGGEEVRLLETFAELAAAACRNANAAAGLALAARTDALTGCLNHAALQDGLRREIDRSSRTAQQLSLVLVDLDDFKQVNEDHGHLVGDEVLRRVGHALRSAVRPYDLCARYGGDEFAIVCADTDEHGAAEIAARAIERLQATLADLDGAGATGATAGIARWVPGQDATGLLEEADRALLYGKQQGERGGAILASEIPAGFRPGRFRRAEAAAALHAAGAARSLDADALHGRRQAERLQKRTRQLVLANALGARLAGMQDVGEIVTAATDELHRAFGYYLCAVIRLRSDGFVEGAALRGEPFLRLGEQRWSQPRHAGVIGRCLRERRVVLVNDVTQEPAYEQTSETSAVRAELVAPIWVGGRLWGVVNIEEDHLDAFDDDDARLVQTVADQVGAALRSAQLYEQLERAYLGTAEALAAALEARDAATGDAGSSIVGWCEAVAERIGLAERERRDLRYAAALHDIGTIAIPPAVLDKPGALDRHERAIVERAPLVGEQILAPIAFLRGVAALVRHAHERWDGTGYPDGLSGAGIPPGARIILVCDAYEAMTSDRPYRAALSTREAREELRAHAGSQFDPEVAEALLAVLDAEAEVASTASEGWQSG